MKIRVFIFEDDDHIREALTYILRQRKYEVLEYLSPYVCPIYLDSECNCPQENMCGDIFITDINMPRVSGLEFIASQMKNGCKVITANKAIMSGSWTEEQLEYAGKLGCHIFHKPVSMDELNSWLDECERRIDPTRKLAEIL